MTTSGLVIIGHRGAPVVAPENTMASFLAARDLGADAVELDVHLSRDGQLVVHHDYTLDRTTSGTGPIFDHCVDHLTALDAGSWFSDAYGTEHPPRLEEVLAIEGLGFEIELKGYGEAIIHRALGAVEDAGRMHQVEFTSGNAPLLIELARRRPGARTGLFTPRREPWMTDDVFEHCLIGWASLSPSQVIHVEAAEITARLAERLHGLGKTVHANDIQTAADVERASQAGADRVSANDVQLAVAARRALG